MSNKCKVNINFLICTIPRFKYVRIYTIPRFKYVRIYTIPRFSSNIETQCITSVGEAELPEGHYRAVAEFDVVSDDDA